MKYPSAIVLSLAILATLAAQVPTPPVAPQKPHSFEFHGTKINDPYFWMKDKKNPDVIKHLEAENAYRELVTKHLKPFEDSLYNEMLSHIKETDLSVPTKDGAYWYYFRTAEGKSYPIHCRKKGTMDAAEQIILDVNELAKGQKFLSALPVGPSDDGNLLAFLTDTTGFREYFLSVKDLSTGKLIEDKLVKVAGFAWASDGKTIFYITEDDAKRPHKLWRHTLGEPKEKDVLVFEEKDGPYNLGVSRTRDRNYLVQHSESSTTTDSRILDAAIPAGEWKVFTPRQEGHEYSIDHRDGTFHIRTNKDGAVNFKWMTCPANATASNDWKDFEKPNPAVFVESINLFKTHAVLSEREGGVPQLRVYDFDKQQSHRIAFPEPCYDVNLGPIPGSIARRSA